jgi:hypothetical protein
MNNDYLENEKSATRITKFLWWCAGADQFFLLRSPMQDRVKYAGIGGIVLATGVLAGCAGSVAFDTMFAPKVLEGEIVQYQNYVDQNFWMLNLLFGIIWGLIIFNLDRFIISSTGKGDGTDEITGKEWLQAIPRIVIALILGFTISKPLEIKMLKSEIDVELHKKQESKLAVFDSLTDAKFKSQIAIIDKDLDKIESERNVLVERQKEAEKEYLDQMQGRAGQQGFGPRAKQLLTLTKEWETKIIEFDKKNNYQVNSLKSNREKKLKEADYEKNYTNKEKVKKLDGLLERLSISHEIGFWLGWAITFILLSIEMGPIIFKMMMTKGAYDFMVENYTEYRKVVNGIVKEDNIYEGANGLIHAEKIRFLEVESAIFKRKAEEKLSKEIVNKWEKDKKNQLESNPKDFYTES